MSENLRVAVLVDLPRSRLSGGHVKGWERRARAAAHLDLPLDLTVYFSGPPLEERLSERVRIRQLEPVFSTRRLKFLPYVPDHTDLAPYHPALARALVDADVIHSTDGFFAYAKTAERVSRKRGIPLVTSFHTDTPGYAKLFTRKTIETLFGHSLVSRFLLDVMKAPERQEKKMNARLRKHLAACVKAFASRPEDGALVCELMGPQNLFPLRLGIEADLFGPHRRDRAGVERDYAIPPGRIVVLFVGRLDEGKNIYTLIAAMEHLIAQGVPLHLVTAGVGPAEEALRTRLRGHVSVPGFVDPPELGRLYASADVLGLSSEVEIRSIAGIEAMASALPVLVSEKSGIAPLFDNSPAMRVVPGGVENWREALRLFATDPALRTTMAEAARTFAANSLCSWEQVIEKDFYPVWRQAFEEKATSSHRDTARGPC